MKLLYETNFFKDVEIVLENETLRINVVEFPIINELFLEGVKSKSIMSIIKDNLQLKSRSSMNDIYLRKDKDKILRDLKNLGYYLKKLKFLLNLQDNKVNIKYVTDLAIKLK